MDTYVQSIRGIDLSVDQYNRLLQMSRVDALHEYANFEALCGWFHGVEQTNERAISTTLANVLLQSPAIRERAARDNNLGLIKDMEMCLFRNPNDLPKWRVMFLLAHCRPDESLDVSSYSSQPFDRLLAPSSFGKLVANLSMDNEAICSLTELGKFWYALCYNYGYSSSNSLIYWNTFTELSLKPFGSLESFTDCLIQFGSLYLLLHNHDMYVDRLTVSKFLSIFETKFNDWNLQACQELYCSLDEHRLPQILNIVELLIRYSSQDLKNDIEECFVTPENSFGHPFVHSSFVKLIESPINNISKTTSSILNSLHLRHDKLTHKLVPLDCPPDYVTYSESSITCLLYTSRCV